MHTHLEINLLACLLYFPELVFNFFYILLEMQEQAKADTQPEPVAEEKKEEKAAEEEKKEEAKPPSPFVLFVDLHCVGCAKKIEKSIMRIRGLFINKLILSIN